MHCGVNDFLGISQKFSETVFSKNTAGKMLLISFDYSLNILRTPFNPLMPGVTNVTHT